MANRTVKDASSIHGTNPQYLIEKIIRTRIYDSKYWKEECFALTAELLVDKAMGLRYIGGVFGGNIKPSPFLCLTLKMLQIQPEKDIVIEFIKQDEFKYVRALGCFYLRLVHGSLDCYKYLSPLLNDYRKLRLMDRNGVFQLSYMDQYIDDLLREERYNDVILPRIQKRWVHEENNELEPRISLLEDDLDDLESESEDEEDDIPRPSSPLRAPASPPHHRSERSGRQSPPPRDKRHYSLSPSPDSHKRRRGDKERDRRGERDTRRHRDSGRGERGGDYYDNYQPDTYHDYHHGSGHEYHQHNNAMPTTTDYHHRRPHHQHTNGGPPPPMSGGGGGGGGGDYQPHHHSSSHRGGDYQHSRGEEYHDYHHSRADDGGGGGGGHYRERGGGGDDGGAAHYKEHSSRRKEGHRREDGRREDGRKEDRKKEGRSRKEGGRRREGGAGSLQPEIDKANALRAQLGLPPLK